MPKPCQNPTFKHIAAIPAYKIPGVTRGAVTVFLPRAWVGCGRGREPASEKALVESEEEQRGEEEAASQCAPNPNPEPISGSVPGTAGLGQPLFHSRAPTRHANSRHGSHSQGRDQFVRRVTLGRNVEHTPLSQRRV